MANRILLKNGSVVNVFTGEIEKADVLLGDGKILGVGDYEDREADTVEDVSGSYLCPGFISGIGMKKGAIASSVSHDSHNLIVIGADENDMAIAANRVRTMAFVSLPVIPSLKMTTRGLVDVGKKAVLERRLAEFVMTEYELDRIYGFERETEQQEMFFRLWTLKESYMKATGLGIRLEPKSFGMIARKDEIKVTPPVDEREFYFKEYFAEDGYCYSCCSLSERFCDTMTEVALRGV